MGIGGISMWQLIILLVIVVLVFGTKRLRNMGGDLGAAVKGFRKGMEDDKDGTKAERLEADPEEPAAAPKDTPRDTVKNDTPSAT